MLAVVFCSSDSPSRQYSTVSVHMSPVHVTLSHTGPPTGKRGGGRRVRERRGRGEGGERKEGEGRKEGEKGGGGGEGG